LSQATYTWFAEVIFISSLKSSSSYT